MNLGSYRDNDDAKGIAPGDNREQVRIDIDWFPNGVFDPVEARYSADPRGGLCVQLRLHIDHNCSTTDFIESIASATGWPAHALNVRVGFGAFTGKIPLIPLDYERFLLAEAITRRCALCFALTQSPLPREVGQLIVMRAIPCVIPAAGSCYTEPTPETVTCETVERFLSGVEGDREWGLPCPPGGPVTEEEILEALNGPRPHDPIIPKISRWNCPGNPDGCPLRVEAEPRHSSVVSVRVDDIVTPIRAIESCFPVRSLVHERLDSLVGPQDHPCDLVVDSISSRGQFIPDWDRKLVEFVDRESGTFDFVVKVSPLPDPRSPHRDNRTILSGKEYLDV
jgi:hypothetical protein